MGQTELRLADLTTANTEVVGLNGKPAGHCGYSLPIIRHRATGFYSALSATRKPDLAWTEQNEIGEMAKADCLTLLQTPISLPTEWDGKNGQQPVVAWFSDLTRKFAARVPENTKIQDGERALYLMCDIREVVEKLLREIATTAQTTFDTELAEEDRKWPLLADAAQIGLHAARDSGQRYWLYARRAISLYFAPRATPEFAYQLFKGAVEPTYSGTTWDRFFECMCVIYERGEYSRTSQARRLVPYTASMPIIDPLALNPRSRIYQSVSDCEENGGNSSGAPAAMVQRVCMPKSLPTRLLVKAAATATKINPVNAPMTADFSITSADFQVMEPERIATLTSKYWGPAPRQLTVSFMESTPADLRDRIISHMNAWTLSGCISFVWTSGTGNVRISREPGGYYSYLGTDILHIPTNLQTMNLEAFTMDTPESEFRRVVRHQTGHTLGAVHEHLRRALVARIDPQKAYDYFLKTQGWNKQMVDAHLLTPLDQASLMSTPPDQTSIMCYQLPGSITFDGQPIIGGTDINPTDYAFIGKIYPKPSPAVAAAQAEAWPGSDDVDVTV